MPQKARMDSSLNEQFFYAVVKAFVTTLVLRYHKQAFANGHDSFRLDRP